MLQLSHEIRPGSQRDGLVRTGKGFILSSLDRALYDVSVTLIGQSHDY